MDTSLSQRFRGLSHLVGNTPLLAIDLLHEGRPRRLYAKAENLNMTGSIK
ncbi:cysteine synthase, partial [bacterium]|nr:cysteine synthase [bacterium]